MQLSAQIHRSRVGISSLSCVPEESNDRPLSSHPSDTPLSQRHGVLLSLKLLSLFCLPLPIPPSLAGRGRAASSRAGVCPWSPGGGAGRARRLGPSPCPLPRGFSLSPEAPGRAWEQPRLGRGARAAGGLEPRSSVESARGRELGQGRAGGGGGGREGGGRGQAPPAE